MRIATWKLASILVLVLSFMHSTGAAQGTYPSSPVRWVLGYATGSGADAFSRTLWAQKLSTQMNATVIVENKTGASGHIANEFVAKSRPDGYTLLYNDAGVTTGPALGGKLGYEVFRDLVPVSLLFSSSHILFAHPAVPANNLTELITHLRANPGKLTYGSSGIGTANHLGPLLFLQLSGGSAVHVPYKGSSEILVDVVAGRIQFGMAGPEAVVPLVKDKRVKALAFSGEKRSSHMPDVPTFSETPGLDGFRSGNWWGVMVPAQTPPAIVRRLNTELVRIIQDTDTKARLEADGSVPIGSTPEEYAAHVKREVERWTKVIKSAGIKLE